MKLTAVLFGVGFIVSTVCAKPEESPTNNKPVAEDVGALVTTETTESSSSVTSTSAPPSTSPKPTTTTNASTTSTTQSPPTTAPTPVPTTAPTPVPTTPKPTTEPPSPTSPKPTPKPAPKEYYWSVKDDKGVICILAKADITLKLTYTNETANGKKEETKDIKILPTANSTGSCDGDNQYLQLAVDNTTISFHFLRNESGSYHLSKIESNITLNTNLGNQSTISLASDDLKVFRTKLNTSYECRWSEPAVLKEIDQYFNVTKATLRVNMDNIRFEAFRTAQEPGDNFSKAYACEMDNTDLVPIMVGIALGILVAVVLIAYLVGRRSTQAQGYLSM